MMKIKCLIIALSFSLMAFAANDKEKSIEEIIDETKSEEMLAIESLDQSAKDLLVLEFGAEATHLSIRILEEEIYALGIDESGNYLGSIKLSTVNSDSRMQKWCGPCHAGDKPDIADVYWGGQWILCYEICSVSNPGG